MALAGAAGGALLAALITLPASGAVEQQCTGDHTSTAISTNPASPVTGATTVTISAHVADLDQTPLTPVGSVVFTRDGSSITSPVTIDGSGNASTSALMTTGIHTITAIYSGGTANNVTFCGSASGSVPYIVNPAGGTTTTTPVPPPAGNGNVIYQTCAAAFRAGVHDIPRGNPAYLTRLDRDGDGKACEQNGDDNPVTVIKPGPTTIVKPGPTTIVSPPPAAAPNVIIVPPAPSGSNYSQIGQAPAGAASTGFGPNA